MLGDVTQPDGLAVLRQVDAIFIQALKDGGLYDKIWQAFAVFLPVRYASQCLGLRCWTPCQAGRKLHVKS